MEFEEETRRPSEKMIVAALAGMVLLAVAGWLLTLQAPAPEPVVQAVPTATPMVLPTPQPPGVQPPTPGEPIS